MPLERDGVVWDGRTYPYMPGEDLGIDPSLPLHTDTAQEIDPVTYEVLRHNLWQVNEEHGATLMKVSGSPVALYGHDFNPTLALEDGDAVYYGPYIQFFSGMADLCVKWTLEHRSGGRGIRDGDMFISSDPWVGTSHQMDNYVLCPVFVDGKLFCWTVNTLHVHEVGGTTPGGFCPDAKDVYWEPTPIPPILLVEGGEVRADVEDMFVRRSRVPSLTRLDLRAQIAGAGVARQRILELVARYGADVVKGAMRRIVGDCEHAFARKLERLPDGEWTDVQYVGNGLPGDRNVYRLQLTMRKQGERLSFHNEGTDPQFGSLNAAYAGWRAAILCALNPMLTFDQLYAGGLVRRLDFRPTPGTITCATHPSAVTMNTALLATIPMAASVIGRMLACDPELKRDLVTSCGLSGAIWTGFSGRNQRGEVFATVTLDQIGGAIGAFSHRDGVSTGGLWWDPMASISNCETFEREYPLLMLYRREVEEGGGDGRWRGGDGIVLAWVPHGVEAMQLESTSTAMVLPSSSGIFGGAPGSPGWHYLVTGSDVRARLADGTFPGSPAELRGLAGEHIDVAPKTREIAQDQDAVWEMRCMSGGGYGDPLQRPVAEVAADLDAGVLSPPTATVIYGVAFDDDGVPSEVRSAALRSELRAARLGGRAPERVLEAGEGDVAIHEYLVVRDGQIACRCGEQLCDANENYKLHSAVRVGETGTLGALFVEPREQVDADVVLREYFCPGCAVRLDLEVALRTDPPVWDTQVDPASVERARAARGEQQRVSA
ncbi:hydantoinase B/oxoprolinase family protein [Conexibacter sp. CPCC 206217]|uniref:hydantoinase B/oxoprolinase family protein n=1 Tax=Conexibacter sp. CPCC 206217 TaxID=3064574 RepID=UPI002724B40F|nr:hydantoinase B/oxoprolinase family protein [Conexibacter sp. CPCC 206217]MDO8211083.1 hydantoinase B/oxoprolinase family protein [Conexibacter sp. CPCC 206217]